MDSEISKFKFIKKAGRIVLWITGVLIFLIGLLFGALQTSTFQTWLAHRAAGYLSDELGTTVTIDRVSIRFFNHLSLRGLLIQDLHKDTLLYSGVFNVSIRNISRIHHSLNLDKITLENSCFKLIRYRGEEHDNLHFLSSYFSSGDTTVTKTGPSPWNVRYGNIQLKNARFKRLVEGDTLQASGVDFSNLDIQQINGEFSDLAFRGDSIFSSIHKLSFTDRSGFKVNEFSADAKVAPDEIRLRHLVIRTPESSIETDLTFSYDSFPSFDNFLSDVRWDSDFRNSIVGFRDIAFFAHDLDGMTSTVGITGHFRGTVKRFRGRKVTLNWGNNSHFRGNVFISGLPEISDTYFDILADGISTSKEDIETIPLPPFSTANHVRLPANLSSLGIVDFQGKFTGFYYDFVAYGNARTAIGYVTSDLNLKVDPKSRTSEYSGHLAATKFNVGAITGNDDLGAITFSADVRGRGLRIDNLDATMSGLISGLEFRNYNYRNIHVDAEIARKLFNGSLSIHESQLNVDFKGTIDFRDSLPVFDFKSDVNRAELDTLHLVNIPGNNVLECSIVSRFTGNNPDNITGSLQIRNIFLSADKKMYHINNINLEAAGLADGSRRLILNSDLLDASVEGQYRLLALGDAFRQILPRYLPDVLKETATIPEGQDFTFDVSLKNTTLITENFLPELYVDPNSVLKGKINSSLQTFTMDFHSPEIRYRNFKYDSLEISAVANRINMILDINSSRFFLSSKTFIPSFRFHALAQNNRLNFGLGLSYTDSVANRARINGLLHFINPGKFSIRFDTSDIVLKNLSWNIDTGNLVLIDSGMVSFTNLFIHNDKESLRIDGKIGKEVQENLTVSFAGFHLDNLNPFFGSGGSTIGGLLNGTAYINNNEDNLQVESDVTVSDLTINNDTLGNASLVSRYNNEKKIVVAGLTVTRGSAKVIEIKGNYYASKETDNLDFNIHLDNFYLKTIERYVSDIVSDIGGKVSADLRLSGSISYPVLDGTVDLIRTSVTVNYLNTHYSLSDKLLLSRNEIDLSKLRITDIYNHETTVRGKIYHSYFRNFVFDAEVFPDHFQMLNTKAIHNSLYFGQAIVSGYAHFYGPLENMNMDINISPEKNTVMNIPLNSTSELYQSDFIRFVNRKDSLEDFQEQGIVNLSGIRLNMNLDMNPNATINIIFDEKLGDVISGSGSGSIRLDINTAGDFNMYGTYLIAKGDYLFTLQKLINKKFMIEEGSRITWAGNPYDAQVDLTADYVVSTSSLYNLIQDSTYRRRIPVECRLMLSNKLMNPTISYGITVKGLDPTVQNQVESILNSEQEVSRQVFGLLVFNQFLPLAGSSSGSAGISAGAGAGASASELLSNQVSNWLSMISKDVNIAVNYRASDQYSKDEVKLIVSKSLFNDRLMLEGNFGYTGNNAQNASNLVGDFYAEYKMSKDGRLRLKGFNRSNADNILNYSSPYTQGFGIFFRQQFNDFHDLMQRLKLKKATGDNMESVPDEPVIPPDNIDEK